MSTRRRITVFLLALAGLCLSMGTGLPREQCLGPGLGTGDIAWSEPDFMGLPGSCAPAVETSPKPCAPVVEPLPKPCAPVCPVAVQRVEDPPTPVVKIRVRVPACEVTGQELKYCICVENCSRANAHHVLVKNALPKNARFVRAEPPPTRKTPELQWELGTLPGGCKQEIILVLSATSGTDVTNCARVQFEHGQCVVTRLAGLAPGIKPPVVEAGDGKLTIDITGPTKENVEKPAKYSIKVTNTGTKGADNVLVTATLPEKTTFVSASDGGKVVGNQVAWLLGALESGVAKTMEVVLRSQTPGTLCVKAKAIADRGLSADAEFCTLFVGGVAAFGLEVVDRVDPIPVGGDTSYPIIVVNQGNAPATNIRIKAIIPDLMVLTRARGPADHKLGGKTPDGGQIILFDALPTLAPGARAEYEVYVKALKAGEARFKVQWTADQLTSGPVDQQENTTIFPENGGGGLGARPPGLQTRAREMNYPSIIE
ncbi:MAG TPA: hypothetical protein VKE98_14100 [Gemmataceae bacterium]|nr:hypothetical protein [Gemmataceae bacterium]